MNEIQINQVVNSESETKSIVQASYSDNNLDSSTFTRDLEQAYESSPFIIANTTEAPLHHLKNDCIIPVFTKDNEKTIAHQEFIDVVLNAIQSVFPHQSISVPEIRVSHQIKGRTPDAIHLNVKDLLEHQKNHLL
ncbi:hypothetical protein J2X97_003781 [Epilithonimonas hungarica]|nr:hypothetical protein [Epilithonimonas hungarica]